MGPKDRKTDVADILLDVIVALGIAAFLFYLILSPVFASDTTKVNLNGTNIGSRVSFGRLPPERTLVLNGKIDKNSMTSLETSLRKLSNKTVVYLAIDSPGGSVPDGYTLIQTMRALKAVSAVRVTCIITGAAYSMAAILMSYCDRTFISPIGSVMFHSASYSVGGPANVIPPYVSFSTQYLKDLETDLAKQLGIPYETYINLRRDTMWLTANQAVAGGWVDGIADNVILPVVEEPTDSIFDIFGFKFSFPFMSKGN